MDLRLLAAAVAVVVPLALPGTAWADRPVDRGHDRETNRFTEDCGDFELDVVERFVGHFSVREAPGDPLDEAFLGHFNFSIKTTVTNPETGRSFSQRVHVAFQELDATLVSQAPGSAVYDFRQRESVHLVVQGEGGRPHIQERVVLEHVLRFDTLGDGSVGEPGGTFVSKNTEVVSGAEFEDPDLCEVGAALTT